MPKTSLQLGLGTEAAAAPPCPALESTLGAVQVPLWTLPVGLPQKHLKFSLGKDHLRLPGAPKCHPSTRPTSFCLWGDAGSQDLAGGSTAAWAWHAQQAGATRHHQDPCDIQTMSLLQVLSVMQSPSSAAIHTVKWTPPSPIPYVLPKLNIDVLKIITPVPCE